MSSTRTVAQLVTVVALVVLAHDTSGAAPVVINFDADTAGNLVEDGTVIDDLYALLGVTFVHEGSTSCGTNVYANSDRPAGFGSAPNVVSTCQPPIASDIDAEGLGVVLARLSQPATQVCIDVRPNGLSHFGRLRVFNAAGAEIGAASSTPGATQTLCVDAAGIRSARFAGGSTTAFARFDNLSVTFETTVCSPGSALTPTDLVASVLPSSRSIQVGNTATAFASVLNTGSATACEVSITLPAGIVADFKYNQTDCATNLVIGADDTPVNVPAGGRACFVVSIGANGPFDPRELGFNFSGGNAPPVEALEGINTLLMSAANAAVPDMVALAATLLNDGIVHVPGAGQTGVFAVATANIGAAAPITVSANTGAFAVPVSVLLCETDPPSGLCISPIGPTVTTQVNQNARPTFGIFVTANEAIALDPAAKRIFVVFADGTGAVRGRTSVAVTTQ